MTIYFAGGEDTSYVSSASLSVSTTASQYRSAYSRCGINFSGGSQSFPLAAFGKITFSSPQTSYWFHAQLYYGPSSLSNYILMSFHDSAGVERLVLRTGAGSNQIKLSTVTSGGTFADLATSATGVYTSNSLMPIDIQMTYAVAGSFTLYFNGAVVLTFTGDVTAASGVTTMAGATLSNGIWSELIVASDSTQFRSVYTLAPAAAGNTQSWTPNTVGNINEVTTNDSTTIGSSTANQLSEWTTTTSIPAGTFTVDAVVQEVRISGAGGAPANFEWLCRTADGTDHVQSPGVSPGASLTNINSGGIWSLNPHTGAAWLTSDITSGFNLGVESLT